MLKTKNIAIPAVFGFIFSFFICLISTHKFSSSLLRGIIFAVVFGILGFLIQIVFDKFLSETTEGDFVQSSEQKDKKKSGAVVDITIDDTPLDNDENGPQFFVSNNKHKLEENVGAKTEPEKKETILQDTGNDMNAIPVAGAEREKREEIKVKEKFAQEQAANSKEFKSVQLGTPVSESSAGSTQKTEPKTSNVSYSFSDISEASDIDSLPDIGNVDGDLGITKDSGDLIKDSDFASSGKKIDASELLDVGKGVNTNAETMAKAIQTLLKRE